MIFSDKVAQNTHPEIQKILTETEKTILQIVFRFAQQVGMIPLVGTRSRSLGIGKKQLEDSNSTVQDAKTCASLLAWAACCRRDSE